MPTDPLSIGEAYYTAVGRKNVAEIEKYLHPDVSLIGPLASIAGKQAIIEATKHFTAMFTTLTIRAKFGTESQAMIVYDIDIPGPIGNFPGASLMTFKDGKIVKIQLFYDGRPFEVKKEEIFSSRS
ncbi:MAG: nuclear transport factor 2 family protein [Verrucomicrobia bacterium]|nr:nuclear transport factor 2 family protein [Verrucomicrobiota bacterium]